MQSLQNDKAKSDLILRIKAKACSHGHPAMPELTIVENRLEPCDWQERA